jgi:hypothetical protein
MAKAKTTRGLVLHFVKHLERIRDKLQLSIDGIYAAPEQAKGK